MEKGVVCVTGANGYIGSWLVLRLLQNGYRVRATVRDPENEAKNSHLRSFPGAKERLEIIAADLSIEGSFDKAIYGSQGVFHLASHVGSKHDDDPQEITSQTISGVLNVLRSCIRSSFSVRRVIYTSSASTILHPAYSIHQKNLDEETWTSIEFCMEHKMHNWAYYVSKTKAEREAMDFAAKNNIDLISINPTIVLGPFLTPRIPMSVSIPLSIMKGDTYWFQFFKKRSYVHVDDVVRAHIFLFEDMSSKGRYICSLREVDVFELINYISNLFPHLTIDQNRYQDILEIDYTLSNKKLKSLGFEFKYEIGDMLQDIYKCLHKISTTRELEKA